MEIDIVTKEAHAYFFHFIIFPKGNEFQPEYFCYTNGGSAL